MGTLAAGIKEIFETAKTTGSNVMLCGNDGTPDGHMTMANLASVLGAQYIRLTNEDLNDCTTLGVTYWASNVDSVTNKPNVYDMYNWVMWVRRQGIDVRRTQYLHSVNTGALYFREYNGATWSSWKEVSVDVPSFYKSYSDLSSLANALGVLKFKDYDFAAGETKQITINNGFIFLTHVQSYNANLFISKSWGGVYVIYTSNNDYTNYIQFSIGDDGGKLKIKNLMDRADTFKMIIFGE